MLRQDKSIWGMSPVCVTTSHITMDKCAIYYSSTFLNIESNNVHRRWHYKKRPYESVEGAERVRLKERERVYLYHIPVYLSHVSFRVILLLTIVTGKGKKRCYQPRDAITRRFQTDPKIFGQIAQHPEDSPLTPAGFHALLLTLWPWQVSICWPSGSGRFPCIDPLTSTGLHVLTLWPRQAYMCYCWPSDPGRFPSVDPLTLAGLHVLTLWPRQLSNFHVLTLWPRSVSECWPCDPGRFLSVDPVTPAGFRVLIHDPGDDPRLMVRTHGSSIIQRHGRDVRMVLKEVSSPAQDYFTTTKQFSL